MVAAIVAACTWGLRQFSQTHTKLVDLIYPYVTRMMQGDLAEWSGKVDFSVWQVALYCGIIIALALTVIMIVRHWNPIRLIGLFLTAISLVSLLNTVMYGLNEYAGPLSDDLRMQTAEYAYSSKELEAAAVYYRDQANLLADRVDMEEMDFEELAIQAGNGFEHLVYENGYSVFAGSTQPVKQMNAAGKGVTGKTVPLTGEATVNPKLPDTMLPYAICHEMAHRMCIAIDQDADFAAFLACTANDSEVFRYAGYLNAYRSCLQAMEESCSSDVVDRVRSGESNTLRNDMEDQDDYFGRHQQTDPQLCDLLVCWHIETQVLPGIVEEETRFDPTDKSQVDLSGIVNAR